MTESASTSWRHSKPLSILIVTLAYALAGVVAWFVGAHYHGNAHPLWVVGAADLAATLVIFGVGLIFQNASFYDPYWSLIPPAIGAYLWYFSSASNNTLRAVLLLSLVSFWAARLTYNWLRGWQGLTHEDWRYVDLRAKTGIAYPLVNLSGIHVFPTILVLLGCLAMFPALVAPVRPFNWVDIVAAAVTFGAVMLEAASDQQLRRFVLSNRDPEAFLDTGLWAYSRHPNYMGEVMFWVGVALFGVAADPSWWWVWLGPISMLLLFFFISIPMIDKRMKRKRPAYGEHMTKVSRLFLWFRKKG